jgi:hypothetical protein
VRRYRRYKRSPGPERCGRSPWCEGA